MTIASVSQEPLLALTQDTVTPARVSLLPLLALVKLSTESDVSQMALLCMGRRVGKRVMAQIDTGSA